MSVEPRADRTLATRKYRTFARNTVRAPSPGLPIANGSPTSATIRAAFHNVSLVPAAGGPEKPVSFLANTFTDNIVWSPDRTYLLFSTGQRTETRSVAHIDLIPRTPKFREDQFRDLFQRRTRRSPPRPLEPTPTKNDQTGKDRL